MAPLPRDLLANPAKPVNGARLAHDSREPVGAPEVKVLGVPRPRTGYDGSAPGSRFPPAKQGESWHGHPEATFR